MVDARTGVAVLTCWSRRRVKMERLYISLQDCVVVPNCEIGTNLKITNTKIDYKLLNCGRSLIVALLLFTAVKLIVFLPRVAMVHC